MLYQGKKSFLSPRFFKNNLVQCLFLTRIIPGQIFNPEAHAGFRNGNQERQVSGFRELTCPWTHLGSPTASLWASAEEAEAMSLLIKCWPDQRFGEAERPPGPYRMNLNGNVRDGE
jgi:hypothetical protein